MTTIAIKDGVLSVDTQITEGRRKSFSTKFLRTDNHAYVLCGDDQFCRDLIPHIESYSGDLSLSDIKTRDYSVTIVRMGKSPCVIISYDGLLYKDGVLPVSAFGSGADFAIAAMDLGKSSSEAVKYASTRDIYTGGEIESFDIYTGERVQK